MKERSRDAPFIANIVIQVIEHVDPQNGCVITDNVKICRVVITG